MHDKGVATSREALATRQAGLAATLADPEAADSGFNALHVLAARRALADKRLRSVARTWPVLATVLGGDFNELFAGFASTTPLPARGGPLADGRRFAAWLRRQNRLPDRAVPHVMEVDLHFARRRGGLVPRRGPSARCAVLRRPLRLLVGLAWPPYFGRWVALRLWPFS